MTVVTEEKTLPDNLKLPHLNNQLVSVNVEPNLMLPSTNARL